MVERNPYAPPGAEVELAAGATSDEVVAPRTAWAKATMVALAATGALSLMMLACLGIQLELLAGIERGAGDGPGIAANFVRLQALEMPRLIALIAAVVTFCVWVAGANRTARSLTPDVVKDSPGWAVGWYFVPLANLQMPYLGMREIWSATTARVGGRPLPAVVKIWWGFWVARLALGAGLTMYGRGADTGERFVVTWIQIAWELCNLAGATTAIAVVWLVARAQRELAR